MEKLKEQLSNKNVAMIALSNSTLGYSPSAYNFLDEIVNRLNLDSKSLTVFNTYLYPRMSEEYIEDMLSANISLKDMKNINHEEINGIIEKIIEEKNLPNDSKIFSIIRSYLKIKERPVYHNDEEMFLRDIIRSNDEVSIFYITDMDDIPKEFVQKELEQRKRNYHTILSLNPDAQIYAIGLTSLKKEQAQEINECYQRISSQFGTVYVDPAGIEIFLQKEQRMYYLSQQGIPFLANKYLDAMYQYKVLGHPRGRVSKVSYITETSERLEYMINRSIKRLKEIQLPQLSSDSNTQLFLQERIKEEQEKQKIYLKILKENK